MVREILSEESTFEQIWEGWKRVNHRIIWETCSRESRYVVLRWECLVRLQNGKGDSVTEPGSRPERWVVDWRGVQEHGFTGHHQDLAFPLRMTRSYWMFENKMWPDLILSFFGFLEEEWIIRSDSNMVQAGQALGYSRRSGRKWLGSEYILKEYIFLHLM